MHHAHQPGILLQSSEDNQFELFGLWSARCVHIQAETCATETISLLLRGIALPLDAALGLSSTCDIISTGFVPRQLEPIVDGHLWLFWIFISSSSALHVLFGCSICLVLIQSWVSTLLG